MDIAKAAALVVVVEGAGVRTSADGESKESGGDVGWTCGSA